MPDIQIEPWMGLVLFFSTALLIALLLRFRVITRERCAQSNFSMRLTGLGMIASGGCAIGFGIAELFLVEPGSKNIITIRLSIFGGGLLFLQIGMLCLILGKQALRYLTLRTVDQQFPTTTHQTTAFVMFIAAIAGTVAFWNYLMSVGYTPVR